MLGAAMAGAQQIELGGTKGAVHQNVMLLTDSLSVGAGKAEEAELRFRVLPGLHINSHAPKDELMIPTVLKLVDEAGVHATVGAYPAGQSFRLGGDGGELLSVYEGEFRVRVRVQATPGQHELTGTLRYQACDSASCFPPWLLPVRLLVTAK